MAEHQQETTTGIQTDDIDHGNGQLEENYRAVTQEDPSESHAVEPTESENLIDISPSFQDADTIEGTNHAQSQFNDGEERPLTASDITLQTDNQEMQSQPTETIKDSLDQLLLQTQDNLEEITDNEQEKQAKIVVWLKNLDPRFVKLIYWQDWKETGVVFASTLILLLTLKFNSLLSVLAFFGMATLLVTFACRVFNTLMQVLHKKQTENPFQNLLDKEIKIPREFLLDIVDKVLQRLTPIAEYLRNLFLVVDIVESLQFGISLWLLSCIGSWFSDLTIVIIAVTLLFTAPVIYENNQAQIDIYINLAKTEINNVMAQVDGLIPGRNKSKDKED
ncbi:Reticulon-4 [Trichoplax sp. H2]|nr:Reticulon-4 [Trichoplax sp. H2]|eukprot:RDD44926.1 Reticulon-4 [Trichoplax sp. H2]